MGHEGRVQRHRDEAVKVCWCLTWGVAEAQWPGWKGQTGRSVVNSSEELRLSPKDNKKQGSDLDTTDKRPHHRWGWARRQGRQEEVGRTEKATSEGRITQTWKHEMWVGRDTGSGLAAGGDLGAVPSF